MLPKIIILRDDNKGIRRSVLPNGVVWRAREAGVGNMPGVWVEVRQDYHKAWRQVLIEQELDRHSKRAR